MVENATAIVLRTSRYSETSLIVEWLCDAQGRLSTIAKGALKPGSALFGRIDLFYLAQLSFNRSTRSELHTLREVSLSDQHPALRTDLRYLEQASYCAALIRQATEADSPIPEIFQLFRGFLAHLGSQSPQPRTVYAFELKLLAELGLAPDFEKSNLSEASRSLVIDLLEKPWEDVAKLTAARAAAVQIRQFLHGYLIYHLGRLPPGRARAVQ